MEQFENKFIKPLFQKKNRLSYELQGTNNKKDNDEL